MFPPRSLHTKLMLLFLALTLIPLMAIGAYGHFFTRTALSQGALDRSIHQVHLQAENIVSALDQVRGDALHLAALRSLDVMHQQTISEDFEVWRREVEQDFMVLVTVRPMYHGLRLLTEGGQEILEVQQLDGQQVISTPVDQLGDYGSTFFFNAVVALPTNGVFVAPFLIGDVPYIHYMVHLPDGVLVIDLNAGWLLRALPMRPESDTWAMLDQDGRFIVYPEGFDPQSADNYISTMLEKRAGSFETASSVFVYDTIYPSVRSDAQTTNEQFWVIFRQTPIDVLYASVNDFYGVALVFMIGASVFAVLLALLTSRLLVNPIKQLERLAAQFGHTGITPQFPQRLPEDEIGSLTRTFFNMAHELEDKRNQERRLIERLIYAQEEERKLVAYDLHDGLLPQLVGARFYLSNPETGDASLAQINLRRGCDALTEAIIEGRRIIEGLRPAALDDLGLAAALEEIARTTSEMAGWSLRLDIQPIPVEPDKTVSVTLYRIAQEALNNARKHANARQMGVSLHNGVGIFLTIEDDGVGFDIKKPMQENEGESRGLGITTMRERAALIDGQCTIYSQPGKGTRVEVYVPLVMEGQNGIRTQPR